MGCVDWGRLPPAWYGQGRGCHSWRRAHAAATGGAAAAPPGAAAPACTVRLPPAPAASCPPSLPPCLTLPRHPCPRCLQAINDGVGLVVHSLLLVPYYSWKHSHRRHHSNTGSLAKDEARAELPPLPCFAVCSCRVTLHVPCVSLARSELHVGAAVPQARAPALASQCCRLGFRLTPTLPHPPLLTILCRCLCPPSDRRWPTASSGPSCGPCGEAAARPRCPAAPLWTRRSRPPHPAAAGRRLCALPPRRASPALGAPLGLLPLRPSNPPPPLPLHYNRSLAKLLFSFTLGWPAYLFFNVSGRPYDKAWVNHFDPWSPIFRCGPRRSPWEGGPRLDRTALRSAPPQGLPTWCRAPSACRPWLQQAGARGGGGL